MASSKKLLILGGSETQLPLIEKAKKISKMYIVDGDNSCIASKNFKKNFLNISTLNFSELKKIATKLKIDGACTYASDPSSLGVGYLNSEFCLNGFDFSSSKILQNKSLFRNFQKKIKLNFPFFQVYENFSKFYLDIKKKKFKKKIVIKPTDRAGSLGVNIIESNAKKGKLKKYFYEAKKNSFEKKIIVENCISKKGFQIAGDGFIFSKKKIKFFFAREHFSRTGKNNVPIGESFPLIGFDKKIVKSVKNEIKKLMHNLSKVGGPFNIDVIVDKRDKIYILEIGPRSGGNLIPEVINLKYGFDIIKNTINFSLSNKIKNKTKIKKNFFCSYVVHSNKSGYFRRFKVSEQIKKNLVFCRIFLKKGQYISKYMSSKNTIGLAILKFSTKKEINFFFENHDKFLSCEVAKK